MLNNMQCKLLVEMLQEDRDAIIDVFPDLLTSPSKISHPSGGLLCRDFHRIVKHVESLIVKCAEEPWVVSALIIGDCKEEFCLRISEIVRLKAILQEAYQRKEKSYSLMDRNLTRWWLNKFDEIVDSTEPDCKVRMSSAAAKDETTLRVRLSSPTWNSDLSNGSPEHDIARYLLRRLDNKDKIGHGSQEDEIEEGEFVRKDDFFCVTESDVKVGDLTSATGVRKVTWMGKEFALRTLSPDFSRDTNIDRAMRPHPNIVQCIGLVSTDLPGYLPSFLEELTDLDLWGLDHSKITSLQFDIFGALDIMLQIAQAMKCMHDQDVVHRDLQPSSILLNRLSEESILDNDTCMLAKVSSFNSDLEVVGATPLIRPDHQNLKHDDVYNYALTCVGLLGGKLGPFHSMSGNIDDGLELPDSCPRPLKRLLEAKWLHPALKRVTFNNICMELIRIKSVLMIDGNMQALPVQTNLQQMSTLNTEENLLPRFQSLYCGLFRHEGELRNPFWMLMVCIHMVLIYVMLSLLPFLGIWIYCMDLIATRCLRLRLDSMAMKVSVSMSIYLFLQLQVPVVWKYRTWWFLRVVMGSNSTKNLSLIFKESIPGLAPCNSFVDVGSCETKITTFMARSFASTSAYQNLVTKHRIFPTPLHGLYTFSSKIGSGYVSAFRLPRDKNVKFTSEVRGKTIERFVATMDLERLGIIYSIFRRWELSPGIGVIENLINRPRGIYCHCLSLQSIVEGVCKSTDYFAYFVLPAPRTFYVGCMPENQRGLFRQHIVTSFVALIVPAVSSYYQLEKDYRTVAISTSIFFFPIVVGAFILDIFGGFFLQILCYRIFYVLGGRRRSSFYLWLKKHGSPMAFCDDFKPELHYASEEDLITLLYCDHRQESELVRHVDLGDVGEYGQIPNNSERWKVLTVGGKEVEWFEAGNKRRFRLSVSHFQNTCCRNVEAVSEYDGRHKLETQIRLDDCGTVKYYRWDERSYLLFVCLMVKRSVREYGVIRKVEYFIDRDYYHVFGTHELAKHIEKHNLCSYRIVNERNQPNGMVLLH